MPLFGQGFDPQNDLPNLTGKVIIVTGGNAGIGFTAVKHLVRKGAKVYMGARNEAKATAAIEKLAKEGLGSGELHHLSLDLSDPKLAKQAAEEFLTRETRLDILINNAAQTLIPFNKALYDIQDVFIINYFSVVAFTHALLPILHKTAEESPENDVRIINVSTGGVGLVPPGNRFKEREDFNKDFEKSFAPKLLRYALSKLALTIWTKELQRRISEEGSRILVIASDPGGVHTDGNKAYANQHNFILSRIYIGISWLAFRSAEKGSYPAVFCAASPQVRKEAATYAGAFLDPTRKVVKVPNKDFTNDDIAKELWETTHTLLTEMGAWSDISSAAT